MENLAPRVSSDIAFFFFFQAFPLPSLLWLEIAFDLPMLPTILMISGFDLACFLGLFVSLGWVAIRTTSQASMLLYFELVVGFC